MGIARMEFIQFLLHKDRLECKALRRGQDSDIVHFHEGFTHEDHQAGWNSAAGIWVQDGSELELAIERERQRLLRDQREFWEHLARAEDFVPVIRHGVHYTAHELGTTAGFGGKVFEVRWLDSGREPFLGHLWCQGRIPLWIQDRFADNALDFLDRPDIVSPFHVMRTELKAQAHAAQQW